VREDSLKTVFHLIRRHRLHPSLAPPSSHGVTDTPRLGHPRYAGTLGITNDGKYLLQTLRAPVADLGGARCSKPSPPSMVFACVIQSLHGEAGIVAPRNSRRRREICVKAAFQFWQFRAKLRQRALLWTDL
jgi:hypothetical protein